MFKKIINNIFGKRCDSCDILLNDKKYNIITSDGWKEVCVECGMKHDMTRHRCIEILKYIEDNPGYTLKEFKEKFNV